MMNAYIKFISPNFILYPTLNKALRCINEMERFAVVIVIFCITFIGTIQSQNPSQQSVSSTTQKTIDELKDISSRYSDTMSINEAKRCADALLELNCLEYDNGNYTEALLSLIRAYKISEKIGDDKLRLRIYNNMANVHMVFKDYEGAVRYYENALEIAGKTDDKLAKFSILVNLVNLSVQRGDASTTDRYYSQLVKIPVSSLPNPQQMSTFVRVADGMNLRMKGQLTASYDTLSAVLKDIKDNSLGYNLECNVLDELYKTLLKQGKNHEAADVLENLLIAATNSGDKSKMLEAERAMGLLYSELGDTAASDRHTKAWIELADSIQNFQEFNRITDIMQSQEIERYNNEIHMLNMKEEVRNAQLKAHRIVIIVGGALLLVIVLALIIYYKQTRRLKESHESLFNINKELIDTEQRLRRRLKEIEDNPAPVTTDSPEVVDEAVDLIEQASANNESNSAQPHCSGTEDPNMSELRTRIIKILEESDEVYNTDFSLSKLAKLAGSNTSYVSQLVNDIYGVNLSTTINNLRIKESRRRLADVKTYGSWTIQAIYESVGFKSASTFHSAFKRITGMTPGAFQKMSRNSTL